MRSLVVEDDTISRKMLQLFLKRYGDCYASSNGNDAIQSFKQSLEDDRPYDLVCMDIMMPDMDGHQTLQEIRKIEDEKNIKDLDRVKVIMTTALSDSENANEAFFRGGARSYIVKPIKEENLRTELIRLGLIESFTQ